MFENNKNKPEMFLDVFNECFNAKDGKEGPQWKAAIEGIVVDSIK